MVSGAGEAFAEDRCEAEGEGYDCDTLGKENSEGASGEEGTELREDPLSYAVSKVIVEGEPGRLVVGMG